ncbi:6671_t:CDS:1, partial [Funneliformis caledonium]
DIFSEEIDLDKIVNDNEKEFYKIDEEDIINIENNEQYKLNNNKIHIKKFFNLYNKKLAKLLKTQEIQVIIESKIIDYSKKEFNLDSLLDQNLNN